jgi:hypothetical protein
MLVLNAFDTAYCGRRVLAAGRTGFKGDLSCLRWLSRSPLPWIQGRIDGLRLDTQIKSD